MKSTVIVFVAAGGLGGGLGWVSAASAASPPDTAALIASAASAAPASIGKDATVMVMNAKGMSVLRKGTNGWTCFPDDPATPGKDPMCLDANGMAWMDALSAHKPPPKGKIGLSYMLQGGSDASNLDPFLTKPPAGAKWVTTGPHVMVLSAQAAAARDDQAGRAGRDQALCDVRRHALSAHHDAGELRRSRKQAAMRFRARSSDGRLE